jgi:hypothetical protein
MLDGASTERKIIKQGKSITLSTGFQPLGKGFLYLAFAIYNGGMNKVQKVFKKMGINTDTELFKKLMKDSKVKQGDIKKMLKVSKS